MSGNNITLIDTCSLLAVPGSEIYLRNLRTSRGHITVLRAVMDELRKKTRDPDVELRNKAIKDGILPEPSTNNVGTLDGESFFNAVETLSKITEPVMISAVASGDIYTEGPVVIEIDFEQ